MYLQGSECVCIKSRTSWPASVDPSNCNFQCQNTSNIYKNECGGNSSYNVFEFNSGISTHILYFLFELRFFFISKISYEATVGASSASSNLNYTHDFVHHMCIHFFDFLTYLLFI